MNITEKEVITLASAVIQGIFSNPNLGQTMLTKEIELIHISVTQCRIALLRAGYTIYNIKT